MNKLYAQDVTNNMDRRVLCDELGYLQVDVQTLPATSATGAKQDTANTSLSSIDGKIILPTALDDDRLKIRSTNKWQTNTVFSTETIGTGATTTSSTIDFTDRDTTNVHTYWQVAPLGSADLSVLVEHSFDTTKWFPITTPISISTLNRYELIQPLSRYVRFAVTNNDASSADVTLHLGYFA
jgi:hypothetical protein